MLVMVVFFIAFRWIHLSTPLIRLFLLVLILLLMPTLNLLPVWFALSLLRFRLPYRLHMMYILWMVAMMVVIIPSRTVFFFFQAEDGIRDLTVTGVQTCALPIFGFLQELEDYLKQLEEAKKRDHRRIGKELDLFSLQEEAGPGLVFWHPKGALIRNRSEERRVGKECRSRWSPDH